MEKKPAEVRGGKKPSSRSRIAGRAVRWLALAITIVGVTAIASVAAAALTFSGTAITGDDSVIMDGAGVISIGTSTATGITIGRSGTTTTFSGNLSITGTCTGCFPP